MAKHLPSSAPGTSDNQPLHDRSALRRLGALLGKARRSLSDYHQCGELLRQLQQANPGLGKKWIHQVYKELPKTTKGSSLSLLYRLFHFAPQYTAQEIRDLEGKVTWTHLFMLVPLENAKLRNKLLRQTIAKHWSIRQLRTEIDKEPTLYRRARGGQPKPATTSSDYKLALRALGHLIRHWERKKKIWQDSANSPWKQLATLRSDEISDDLRDELDYLAGKFDEIATELEAIGKRFKALPSRLQKPSN